MKRLYVLLLFPVFMMCSSGPCFPERETAVQVSPVYEPAETPAPTPTATAASTPTPTPTATPQPTENPAAAWEQATRQEDEQVSRYEDIPSLASDYEIELIGRVIWGEAGGISSEYERACVAWTILNRCDRYGWSIEETVMQPNQFYVATWGTCPEEHLRIAADVVSRWEREHAGEEDVGRVLPEDCLWYWGDGSHNWFRSVYEGGGVYHWELPNPYES